MVVLGYFMISKWKFPSVKTLHIRVPSFHLVIATCDADVFSSYHGILPFSPPCHACCDLELCCFSLDIVAFIRLIAGKKSKTHKDFEPDNEE
jgi:CDP-diacylglycerol--serine O-phosphatidyltransferase